jgi:hypothetical protein
MDAYDAYKKKHQLENGKFYIIHKEKVLNIPLPTREIAMQIVQLAEAEGGDVDWSYLMILECGNEWGNKRRPDNNTFK